MTFKFFPALFDHPTKIKFAEQERNEVIEIFLRQHWVTNLPWIIGSTIAFVIPIFLVVLRDPIDAFIDLDFIYNIPTDIYVASLLAWYLLVLAYIIENFLHWYFNIYIVTNLHLVDINFNSILNREVVEAGIEKVEIASSKISGVVRSLFNYGDVIVQTAAESHNITFLAIPYPDIVADRINDLRGLRGGFS